MMKASALGFLLTFCLAIGHAQTATFLPGPITYSTQRGPLAMTTADFNGDGATDFAVADAGATSVSVWLSNGDGTFRPPVAYSVPQTCGPNYLTLGDFTNDGKPDLLATCLFSGMLVVLPGNGDGTFASAISTTLTDQILTGNLLIPVIAINLKPAIADFDGDGNLDLVLTLANIGGTIS